MDLPDFRVCQILWTLRVLKAIELSSLEAKVVEEREPAESIPVDVVDLDCEPVLVEEPAEEPVAVHVADEEPAADEDDHDEPAEESDEAPTEIPVREQTGESVEIEVMHTETDERDVPDETDVSPVRSNVKNELNRAVLSCPVKVLLFESS